MDEPQVQEPPTTLKPDYGKKKKGKLQMMRDYVIPEKPKKRPRRLTPSTGDFEENL